MFKFLMKKMMQAQLKGLPQDQQDTIMRAFEKNPELFKKIAEEVKAETKKGGNQQLASMKVMMKYKSELQELMK
jgi:hypothetical protein